MKYLRYVSIILFKLFAKVFGLLWFWVVVWFRAYARNRVYNYVLQNDVYLKRLLEREPEETSVGTYYFKNVHNVKHQGYLDKRYVSKLEYYFCFWFIWGWVDDDSNHDTMSGGVREDMVYGNTFDLGDCRARFPELNFVESWKWLQRNTAYNFNYMLEECLPTNKNFFYYRFTNKLFDWHFGYLPEGNKRAGRMVWFTEDINKV